MRKYAPNNPQLVMNMLNHMDWSEKDNLAYNITSNFSDAELASLDKNLLEKLSSELESGWTKDVEEKEIERLSIAQNVKPTKTVEINKTLSDLEISSVAKDLGIEFASIKAIIEVEAHKEKIKNNDGKIEKVSSGFLSDGRPAILFEGHIFWNKLKENGKNPKDYQKGNEDILYPSWTKQYYKGGIGEYERMEKAKKIDEDAALKSASYGLFQVMGYNFDKEKYKNVEEFVNAQNKSELFQLDAFVSFIKVNNLIPYLKNKNWPKFAEKYNGPKYKENQYDTKLFKAYEKYKNQKM
jgi:hypothetical protein